MQICGLIKTSLLDYPEHISATIFTGGCNFQCPFCHNKDLVLRSGELEHLSKKEVLSFLQKRKGILTGVCVSGGEPTLHHELPDFLNEIKTLGYAVKLDTNGSNPDMLMHLMNHHLIDYIAMDIKSDLETYDLVAGLDQLLYSEEHISFILSAITKSVNLIKNSNIPYEFRTTVVRELHKESTFQNIAHWLNGSKKYYLQNYTDNEQVISPGFTAYTKEELLEFVKILSPYIREVSLRGIL